MSFSGSGGTEVFSDEILGIRTGVKVFYNGAPTSYVDAISIEVKGLDPHVVQFISREIIDASGQHIPQAIQTTGGVYDTTIDPVWNTDSAAHPLAYYDVAGAASYDDDGLTVFDQPALLPSGGQTWRAVFKSYIFVGGKVVREVTWVRSKTEGADPYYFVDAKPANTLPEWAVKTLQSQGYNMPG